MVTLTAHVLPISDVGDLVCITYDVILHYISHAQGTCSQPDLPTWIEPLIRLSSHSVARAGHVALTASLTAAQLDN